MNHLRPVRWALGVLEGGVLDARLDSKVGIRRHFLYQSSASVECRQVGEDSPLSCGPLYGGGGPCPPPKGPGLNGWWLGLGPNGKPATEADILPGGTPPLGTFPLKVKYLVSSGMLMVMMRV